MLPLASPLVCVTLALWSLFFNYLASPSLAFPCTAPVSDGYLKQPDILIKLQNILKYVSCVYTSAMPDVSLCPLSHMVPALLKSTYHITGAKNVPKNSSHANTHKKRNVPRKAYKLKKVPISAKVPWLYASVPECVCLSVFV